MDNEDIKIKQFITKDKTISEKANKTFDNFIQKVQTDDVLQQEQFSKYQEKQRTEQYKEDNKPSYFMKFKKLMTVAASLMIVVVASNVYARTQGYDNIFFLIKDLVTKEEKGGEEIFSDRDIVISYKAIQITDDIELQINELQIKDNKAKLYLLVKELKENSDTPLNYKVFNDENQEMFNESSSKKQNKKTYTEVLNLKNYKDTTNIIKMEIYNKNKTLLKTITMNLNNKTIEARTENQVVKKISQIELNKFLKQETEKLYTTKELKDKQIIILDTYDIFYSNGKYIAKYLYMMPTEEEFENDEVEKSTIYSNTIEFTSNDEGFTKIKIEKSEMF